MIIGPQLLLDDWHIFRRSYSKNQAVERLLMIISMAASGASIQLVRVLASWGRAAIGLEFIDAPLLR